MLLAALTFLALQSPDSSALRHSNGVPPTITAVRVARPPVLDGRLDDSVWTLAAPITDLRQSDPEEGHLVSESTAVRLLYDDEALYIGVRLFDREPGKIARHLGRRDSFTQSDDFRVLIDSYHDHRTAYRFDVNPLGVKHDLQFGDDGNFADDSWDPVWEVATSVDSLGWSAEYRIPFSQLRFSRARDQVWGVRFVRTILRKNEFAMWPFIGKTDSVGRGTFHQPSNPANPFDKSSDYFGGAGLDLKYGVTSNLTLDATMNPDFGQVEIDPAFVNLTAFEQFLPEHRPFFVEGADIFGFGGGSGGFVQFGNAPQFFYSRRIGHRPLGSPFSAGQFVDNPEHTTILGAAKLTGRSPGGWSVGVLDAATARERATVLDTTTSTRSYDPVEPLTNYFVGRAKRTLNGGNDGYGFVVSAVSRDLGVPALKFLRTTAYDWGVDARHRWGQNTYAIAADIGGSFMRGDTLAIQATQHSSSRYYQRPDARSFHYDPRRTSLSGLTGDLYVDKLAGTWLWGAAVSTTTPGFEVNDLGFQRRVDRIASGVYVAVHQTRPGRVIREATVVLTGAPSWNFDGDPIQRQVFASSFGTFRNFWFFNLNGGYSAQVIDDRLTRGGPLSLIPQGWFANAGLQTDQRKAVTGGVFGSSNRDVSGGWSWSASPQVSVRPSGALSLSLSPNFSGGRSSAQFVQRVPDTLAARTFGTRYVFAQLRQHELDLALRLDATVSPTLSLQVYAQPFTFVGEYGGYKELAAPRTFRFDAYGQANGSSITYDATAGTYTVHPEGAQPADSFTIANPSFRTRSVRINAVLRWEYRPGSTLFIVWTQNRAGDFADPTFDVGRDLGRELLKDRPTNVLLVKFNYWMSL
jgi:hypothetical protein